MLDDLLAFIDACPTPFHVVEHTSQALRAGGFCEMNEADAWDDATGNCFISRGGGLVAWCHHTQSTGFRIIGAHTDSPNLRVAPQPDKGGFGYQQLGVEVYGGVLLNSWLDRDLGVAGRVVTPQGQRLFRIDEPILRVPQLAIHLDREVNQAGLLLNPQAHLSPIWGLGMPTSGDFRDFVASVIGVLPHEVLAFDAMCYDLTPAVIGGAHQEFVFAARIDNQVSCWAGLQALLHAGDLNAAGNLADSAVLCLFDHEEVGSVAIAGATSTLLPHVLERIVGSREALHPALARSVCVSADGAHATHPNYSERHEPNHHIGINQGPVIKRNANQRYATDAVGEAAFVAACEVAGISHQVYMHRADMACGSTIGPFAAATTGITTVDVGVAQLSMHSAREMCGTQDPIDFVQSLKAFVTHTNA